jgi:serine phosphatase RsbU (regulator of sigma subunit)
MMNPHLRIRVRGLMSPKPIHVEPTQPVRDAVEMMNTHRIGAVLVAERGERLVGIFTERDFLRHALNSGSWEQACVHDWMSPSPYTIHPDAGWEEAVSSMERLRVRHLPVVEDGKLVGIVTARQLIAQRANHLNEIVGERTRELRRANEALLARDSEVTHYMKSAAKLQQRLVLPHTPPEWPEVAWGVHFEPLDPLGGDYYDFAQPDDNHIGILIADASGHGIPAAMVAIMTRMAFTEIGDKTIHPGEVLAAMNRRLLDMADERFVTAFYGVLDRQTRRFTYANAGHPYPLRYVAKTQECEPLTARGFLLGITPDEVYTERTVDLEPGDRLCFFTDGVPDCRDERGEAFEQTRIRSTFQQLARGSASAIVAGLITAIRQFTGTAKQIDDSTLVIAELR